MKNIGDIKCLNDPNVVYLCDDFINSTNFKYLQSCGKFIIGPAIVRSRALQSKVYYFIILLPLLFYNLLFYCPFSPFYLYFKKLCF